MSAVETLPPTAIFSQEKVLEVCRRRLARIDRITDPFEWKQAMRQLFEDPQFHAELREAANG